MTGSEQQPHADGAAARVPGTTTPLVVPQPPRVSSARVTLVGSIGWALALVVILVVPALHEGERGFWPWACVTGIVLGLLGFSYVRRGRGNAEGAEPTRS